MAGFAVFLPRDIDDNGLRRCAEDFEAAAVSNIHPMGAGIVNIDLADDAKASELRNKGYTIMSGRCKALVM